MCRSFIDLPVDRGALDRALTLATRAPSAGNTQGWAFVVLEGDETALFWAYQAESSWLAHPSHPGLLSAPIIVLPLASRTSYIERYSEPDKAPAGLQRIERLGRALLAGGHGLRHHAVPAGVNRGRSGRSVLLPPEARRALLDALGVPGGWEPLGAIAVGWPSPDDQPSTSANRPRRPVTEVVHRGAWGRR